MASISDYVQGLSLLATQMNEQVRGLVRHSGEKGRAAEHIARSIIRAMLPKRFSIGSGFIVTSRGKNSPQLDIVLFDEQMNAPISLIGDIGVFPVECVYGAIEVKSRLTSTTLAQAAKAIGKIRQLKREKFYRVPILQAKSTGELRETWGVVQKPLSPRTYIIAFDTSYRSIQSLQHAIERAADEHEAFFHGVIILNKDKNWFVFQYATKRGRPRKFACSQGNAVTEFAMKLSKDTIRYPMYAADMVRYLGSPEEEA